MKPKKALIIDDDRLLRKILERAFTEQGWNCTCAEDGEAGWQMIHSLNPDLLVLDIFLPGKWSGMDLLRMLKAENKKKNMTVVMVTAGDPAKYLVPSREAGADILIPKPFSPKSFITQVQGLLSEKEAKR
jgi:DNA-binding response OmpR family regulator